MLRRHGTRSRSRSQYVSGRVAPQDDRQRERIGQVRNGNELVARVSQAGSTRSMQTFLEESALSLSFTYKR